MKSATRPIPVKTARCWQEAISDRVVARTGDLGKATKLLKRASRRRDRRSRPRLMMARPNNAPNKSVAQRVPVSQACPAMTPNPPLGQGERDELARAERPRDALELTTDQKVGGSNPSERAKSPGYTVSTSQLTLRTAIKPNRSGFAGLVTRIWLTVVGSIHPTVAARLVGSEPSRARVPDRGPYLVRGMAPTLGDAVRVRPSRIVQRRVRGARRCPTRSRYRLRGNHVLPGFEI